MSRRPTRPEAHDDEPVVPTMPIGHNKGVPLAKIDDGSLRATRAWCVEHDDGGRWKSLIEAIDEELEGRQGLPLGLDFSNQERGR